MCEDVARDASLTSRNRGRHSTPLQTINRIRYNQANFAQEVMRGQLALLVGGLRGQSVELFGRSEAFVSGPDYPLLLLDHVHEFDPDECVLRGRE